MNSNHKKHKPDSGVRRPEPARLKQADRFRGIQANLPFGAKAGTKGARPVSPRDENEGRRGATSSFFPRREKQGRSETGSRFSRETPLEESRMPRDSATSSRRFSARSQRRPSAPPSREEQRERNRRAASNFHSLLRMNSREGNAQRESFSLPESAASDNKTFLSRRPSRPRGNLSFSSFAPTQEEGRNTRGSLPTKGSSRGGARPESKRSPEPSLSGSGENKAKKARKGLRKNSLTVRGRAPLRSEEFASLHPVLSPQLIAMRSGRESKGKNRFENRYYRLSNRRLSPEIQKNLPDAPRDSVKMIPLGGLCEIGKNMTAYEYGDDVIVVDVGVAFAGEDQPGVDAIIPGMEYIFKNRQKLRGIFITHGHEDHIGSIRWLLRELRCPVYGGPMTIKLIEGKLEEAGLQNRLSDLHVIRDGEVQRAGSFDVEFIHVNHSIADSSALAIRCPAGLIIHSGDFKIDYTPIHGKPIDLPRFSELGDAGVLLFVCESTNIGKAGFSMSESKVGLEFSKQFDKAGGRVIVATFSSNVHRVQQVISAAEEHGRKVLLLGRSMLNVFRAANDLGYIRVHADTLIEDKDLNKYPDDQICIIMTGSQGEPLAALSRIAYAEHRSIDIKHGDRIILSANTIPGNEKPIFNMIDELYKRGAEVIYSQLADVHVSGHAYREEIKILHELVRPKYFVPVHGEYRMLAQHSELCHELGMPYERIFLLNNGDICAFSDDFAGVVGYVNANPVFIDGLHPQPSDTSVLNERRALSEDGVLAVSLTVGKRSNRLLAAPQILSYGYLFEADRDAFPRHIQRLIQHWIEKATAGDRRLAEALRSPALKQELLRFCQSEYGRSPVTLIQLSEVED